MPRWPSPVRREPGKLVRIRPRRSSNLLLGVILLIFTGEKGDFLLVNTSLNLVLSDGYEDDSFYKCNTNSKVNNYEYRMKYS